MKMIEVVIKPQKLDAINLALTEMGILGVTALEVKGFGRQKGHTERYRGSRMNVGFVPKVMLKIAVKDEDLDRTVEAITSNARTGEVGDGKMFIYNLEGITRIRTGETDDVAL